MDFSAVLDTGALPSVSTEARSASARMRQPRQHPFTHRKLVKPDEFIGLMRLRNRAWSAHHGRHAGALEQTGFGAERDQRGALRSQQSLDQGYCRITRWRFESRHGGRLLETKTCCWIDCMHFGL